MSIYTDIQQNKFITPNFGRAIFKSKGTIDFVSFHIIISRFRK